MPQFQVKQKIVFPATLDDIQTILKVPLNDEWYILFCLARHCNNVCAQPMNISVEIHRQNMDGIHSISGELKIMNGANIRMWEKKYSQMIKIGAEFIRVDAFVIHISGCFTYWLLGIVNISDNCENSVNALENGRYKESNLKSLEELSRNLDRLLDPKSTCFSDVTIKCGSESIRAHKIILSARSPVFAFMFSHPMKESLKNEVDISDMDVSVLRALLTYMYSGKTNYLSAALAEGLLFAADKYQLDDLKSVCCDVLKDSVSLQNVLRILVLGELHAEDLKSFVVDYICKKSAEFSALEKSEEWKTLRKDRPQLAIDVLSSLVNFKNKN